MESQSSKNKQSIRLLIVDDHNIARKGIRVVLEDYDEIEVIGEAETGEKAFDIINQLDGAVDVILMDVDMPGEGGIAISNRITKYWPKCSILFLTAFSEYSEAGFLAGAKGYVLKEADDDEIMTAIRAVYAGKIFISQFVQEKLIDVIKKPIDPFSPREYDILRDLREGLSNAKIAEKQGLSENTVRDYVSVILKKIDAENRTQAVVIALRRGLIK